jgi:hypothetical protein
MSDPPTARKLGAEVEGQAAQQPEPLEGSPLAQVFRPAAATTTSGAGLLAGDHHISHHTGAVSGSDASVLAASRGTATGAQEASTAVPSTGAVFNISTSSLRPRKESSTQQASAAMQMASSMARAVMPKARPSSMSRAREADALSQSPSLASRAAQGGGSSPSLRGSSSAPHLAASPAASKEAARAAAAAAAKEQLLPPRPAEVTPLRGEEEMLAQEAALMKRAAQEKADALLAAQEKAALEKGEAVRETALQLQEEALEAMLAVVPLPIREGVNAIARVLHGTAMRRDAPFTMRVLRELVEDHDAYVSAGEPFRGYDQVLLKAAARMRDEISPSYPGGWRAVFEDEKQRALLRATEDAAVRDRMRLAEEARQAEEAQRRREQEAQEAEEARVAAEEEAVRRAAVAGGLTLEDLQRVSLTMPPEEFTQLFNAAAASGSLGAGGPPPVTPRAAHAGRGSPAGGLSALAGGSRPSLAGADEIAPTCPPAPKYHSVELAPGLSCSLIKGPSSFADLWDLRPTQAYEFRQPPGEICVRLEGIAAKDYAAYGARRGQWIDDVVQHFIWHVCAGKKAEAAHQKVLKALALGLSAHPVVVEEKRGATAAEIETKAGTSVEERVCQLIHLADELFVPLSRAAQEVPLQGFEFSDGQTGLDLWLLMDTARIRHSESHHNLIINYLACLSRVVDGCVKQGASAANPTPRWQTVVHLSRDVQALIPNAGALTEEHSRKIKMHLEQDPIHARCPLPPLKSSKRAADAFSGSGAEDVSTDTMTAEKLFREMALQSKKQLEQSEQQHKQLLQAFVAAQGQTGGQQGSRSTAASGRKQFIGIKGKINMPLLQRLGKGPWVGKGDEFYSLFGDSSDGKVGHEDCPHCGDHKPPIVKSWTWDEWKASNGGHPPRRSAQGALLPGERLVPQNEVIFHFKPACYDAWLKLSDWYHAHPNDPDREDMIKPLTNAQWVELQRAAGKM